MFITKNQMTIFKRKILLIAAFGWRWDMELRKQYYTGFSWIRFGPFELRVFDKEQ